MPERPKILARAGVVAEQVKAKGRTSDELRQKIRDMVERAIVQLERVAEKEFLQSDDITQLSALNRLLADLDRRGPDSSEQDPSKLTDEQLAKMAGTGKKG